MAIGTAAAIGLGIAGVGGVASAVSSNSASKKAAQASQANTDANVALARDIYGQNKDVLSPFVNRGNAAGEQINALLGLGGGTQQPQVQPNALAQFQGYPGGAGMPYGLGDGFISGYNPALAADQMGFDGERLSYALSNSPFQAMSYQPRPANTSVTPSVTPTAQTAQQAASDAFDTFRNSTGYQFRLGEGLDAVNSAYAGIGGLQSGAAMRGINEYGQNFASNEFGNYLNALGSQQAVGAGSASSLAGVGQNFAGTVIGQNNYNTQNQMNAQLGNQNIFGNALGALGGSLFSYGLGK